MMKNWGFYVKELREQKGLTQVELAKSVGISRSYLSLIQIGMRPSWREDLLRRMADALKKPFSEMVQIVSPDMPEPRMETHEEILDRLKLAQPVSIPVYMDFPFHAGEPTEPIEYVYLAKPKVSGKNIEAYIVQGKCLEPIIQDQDVIVLDREGQIDSGSIVACLFHDTLHLGRLRKIADELYLENNDGRIKFDECQVAAPVIEVIRRLK